MNEYTPALEVPEYLFNWMKTQSQSAFIGGMMTVIDRTGGLNGDQLVAVKVKYIQAGNDIPPKA